jgi:hypothetical protein
MKVVVELDHRHYRNRYAKYNVGKPSGLGDWEYGALIDVSEQLEVEDFFIECSATYMDRR